MISFGVFSLTGDVSRKTFPGKIANRFLSENKLHAKYPNRLSCLLNHPATTTKRKQSFQNTAKTEPCTGMSRGEGATGHSTVLVCHGQDLCRRPCDYDIPRKIRSEPWRGLTPGSTVVTH